MKYAGKATGDTIAFTVTISEAQRPRGYRLG
jgi:hypothetical protein